jgi:hypothetical protein
MSIIQGNTKVSAGGYAIDQSIRFNDNDAAYMSRTSVTPTSTTIFTISLWFKRSLLSSGYPTLINEYSGNSDAAYLNMRLQPDDTINVSGYATNWRTTTRVFRDPSAWYHFVLAVDTNQATAADRIKLYINGVEETSFSANSNPGSGTTLGFNTGGTQNIARINPAIGGTNYFDGYMAEFNFIDGQALAPTDFGETNDDGVWVPKAYAGTYGSNGFYITGEDSADLGADYSGNGNDFTSSGLTSDDQRGDTPTANHATWNPLFFRRTGSYKPTFADGNLYVAGQSSQVSHTGTTISSSGKHYAEFLVNNGSSSITGPGVVRSYWDGGLAQSYASNYGGSYYGDNGTRYYNATSDSQTAPGANRVGIEVDFANNEVEYFIVTSGGTKTSQGGKLTSANGIDFDGEGIFSATLHDNSSRNITAYFEEADWWGTPNTGYKALSTANLPGPAIADGSAYFQTTTYTGAGYPTEVNQSGNSTFQPDFVWVKRRNAAVRHVLIDAVRGGSSILESSNTRAENIVSGALTFDSDGFTAAADPIYGDTGTSGNTFVGWQWLAANGTASNTDGSITSTVSANTTAGFSVVTYTGTGSAATIGHGLSTAPSCIFAKARTSAYNWKVYHSGLTSAGYRLILDSSAAQAADSTTWNNTDPTSSVFSVSTDNGTNASSVDYVAYCFAEVEGFSKFGKYTGNGSTDGPFVWCGFRPAFIMTKRTDSTSSWFMYDSVRDTDNETYNRLFADLTDAEVTSTAVGFDLLSNGFKLRNSNANVNASGGTYVFMAFAEHPFGGDGVAPVPAR